MNDAQLSVIEREIQVTSAKVTLESKITDLEEQQKQMDASIEEMQDQLDQMEEAGLGAYYTDHGFGVYPQAAAGFPFDALTLAVKGDPIADLQEDLAADGATLIVQKIKKLYFPVNFNSFLFSNRVF